MHKSLVLDQGRNESSLKKNYQSYIPSYEPKQQDKALSDILGPSQIKQSVQYKVEQITQTQYLPKFKQIVFKIVEFMISILISTILVLNSFRQNILIPALNYVYQGIKKVWNWWDGFTLFEILIIILASALLLSYLGGYEFSVIMVYIKLKRALFSLMGLSEGLNIVELLL